MLALVNQQPRVLNLKEYLRYFVLFRKEVVTLRTEFDLRKAREKEHILEGLKKIFGGSGLDFEIYLDEIRTELSWQKLFFDRYKNKII